LAFLRTRLDDSTKKLKTSSGSIASKSAWAIWRKKELLRLQDDLERWVRNFHLIYVVLTGDKTRKLDEGSHYEYRRTVSLFRGFGEGRSSDLPVQLSEWTTEDIQVLQEDFDIGLIRIQDGQIAVVEFIRYEVDTQIEDVLAVRERVLRTAKGLCQADPLQTRMLRCSGYFLDEPFNRIGLVLKSPKATV
jgi:hypothetical protein